LIGRVVNRPRRGRYIRGVAKPKLWAYEARRCGPAALILPVLAAAAVVAASIAANANQSGKSAAVGAGMVRLVAILIPIAAGVAAAAALGRERMTELQITVPTSYGATTLRRLILIVAVVVVGGELAIGTTMAFGQWHHPAGGPLALLVPLGPSLLLIGLGAWAQVTLQSTAGASTTVIGGWLIQLIILDRIIGVWQINRTFLSVAGMVLIALAVRRLRDTERLIRGGSE
jgi:hypothetical protein